MLHARVIPPRGGETEFADMRAAYDALSHEQKSLIENLVCDHSLIYSRTLLGFDDFTPEEIHQFANSPNMPRNGNSSTAIAGANTIW